VLFKGPIRPIGRVSGSRFAKLCRLEGLTGQKNGGGHQRGWRSFQSEAWTC
jgi:hypothetical protein